MPIIFLSGTTISLFKCAVSKAGGFMPVVKFDRHSFDRPDNVRLVETSNCVVLSSNIEESKRALNLFSLTVEPGSLRLPFVVEKGFETWDNDGYIEARIEPPTPNVNFVSSNKFKVKYNEKFFFGLSIASHEERSFSLDFFANDNEDDRNALLLKNIHCGRIQLNVAGSSAVGFRLIANIDALPFAPSNYQAPDWYTTNVKEIELSQKQANQYNDCRGICYATSVSRAQKAYKDILGHGVVDLTVSNKNIDHRIASTQGGADPFMGYGAGGPFARRGYGQILDNEGVWAGKLNKGALLQIWNSTDKTKLYRNGGHSIVFRNYMYDRNGNVVDFKYTDYHGGISSFNRDYHMQRNQVTIMGVNLLDRKTS